MANSVQNLLARATAHLVLLLHCSIILQVAILRSAVAGGNRPPNIVVIMADDLGQCDLRMYDGWVATPNIERMAAEGMTFTDFHSNSSVCSPTRAAFLTGRYQQRVGIVDVIVGSREPNHGVAPSTPTLSSTLKANGYATGLFGKWHCGYQDNYNPLHHGFDEFVGFLNGATDYHQHGSWRVGLKKTDVPGYSTQIITARSIDFITRNREHPFFLFVSHAAVHNPYQTDQDTPENRVPGENQNQINDKNRDKYKWMLRDLDKSVGEILAAIKLQEIEDDTLVFFLSDNGAVGMCPKQFRKLRGGKFSHYEGGHRVPAIARWPGKITQGASSDELIVGFDLFPTFCAIAEISSLPNNLDGRSFREHLLNNGKLADRDIFFGYEPKLGTAMRRGDWKMIVKEESIQLFDLSVDPMEAKNVAELHPKIKTSMQRAIEHFKLEVKQGS